VGIGTCCKDSSFQDQLRGSAFVSDACEGELQLPIIISARLRQRGASPVLSQPLKLQAPIPRVPIEPSPAFASLLFEPVPPLCFFILLHDAVDALLHLQQDSCGLISYFRTLRRGEWSRRIKSEGGKSRADPVRRVGDSPRSSPLDQNVSLKPINLY